MFPPNTPSMDADDFGEGQFGLLVSENRKISFKPGAIALFLKKRQIIL